MTSDYFDDEDYYYDDDDDFFGTGTVFDFTRFKSRRGGRVVPPSMFSKSKGANNNSMKDSDRTYSSVFHVNDSENYAKILLDRYKETNKIENAVQLTLFIHPGKTVFQFVELLKKKISAPNITVNYAATDLVEVFNENIYFSLNLVNNGNAIGAVDAFVPSKDLGFDIVMHGSVDRLKKIYKDLRKQFFSVHPQLSWLFKDSDGSINSSDSDVVPLAPVHSEFYPFVRNFDTFAKDYMNSTASVLILWGPPGTGKSNFLRHLMLSLNESAIVTYDPAIMAMDKMFVRFLNGYQRLLILEDSDLILADREKSGNVVMSKILNASSGLVTMPQKKIIFTSNLKSMDDVDPALTRKGRAYDVIHFRNLTFAEAEAAAKKMGVSMPKEKKSEYALSELFNQDSYGIDPEKKSKVGFIR